MLRPSEVNALKSLAHADMRHARILLEGAEEDLYEGRYAEGWDRVQDATMTLKRAVTRFEYLRDDR
jgi:hypothetical protein